MTSGAFFIAEDLQKKAAKPVSELGHGFVIISILNTWIQSLSHALIEW